jgi:hypothetical protein
MAGGDDEGIKTHPDLPREGEGIIRTEYYSINGIEEPECPI